MEGKRKNQAPIRLIVAGLPRTGTKSVRDALKEVGLNCHHMSELYKHRSQEKVWSKALENGGLDPKEWDQLFQDYGYSATSDVPSCLFVKQLAEIYPEAKILILERDPEEWIKSVDKTITLPKPGLDTWIAKKFCKRLYQSNMREFCESILYPPHGIFKSHELDPQVLPDYISDLRDHFSSLDQSSRVLVTSVSGISYPILCNFLSISPPPGNPSFPNTNASEGSKNKKSQPGTTWEDTTSQLTLLLEEIEATKTRFIEYGMGLVGLSFCFLICYLFLVGTRAAMDIFDRAEKANSL